MSNGTEVGEGADVDDEVDFIPVELAITPRELGAIEPAGDDVPTLLDRLLSAGIDAERAQRHLS